MKEQTRWWGHFSVEEGRTGRWRVGPLTLYASRLPGEWRLAWETGGDATADDVEIEPEAGLGGLPAGLAATRHGMERPGDELVLAPVLADRPVVSRPEHRLEVPGGHETLLFVSTPLWVRARAGDPEVTLAEAPVLRESDTWFGPNTRTGELCYSSRTFFRRRLENVPVLPHRATTALRVTNRAATALVLERVHLPVPNLALFCGAGGRLWTQAVRLEHDPDGTEPLRLDDGPPEEVGECEPVAPPLVPPSGNRVTRAFSFIFGK